MLKTSMKLIALLSLAACSGGSGGDGVAGDGEDVVAPDPAPELGFQERLAAADVTPSADLPVTGTAVFDGLFQVAVGTDVDNPLSSASGDARLDVDFADNSLTGVANNFVDQDGDQISGSVNFENGVIDRSLANATIVTETSGSIALDTGDTAFDQQLAGGFFGETGEFIQGVTVTSTDIGEDTVPVVGVLQAEQ